MSNNPILVDSLVELSKTGRALIGNKWYVSRPLNVTKEYTSLRTRLRHAWMVLVGKAHAHQYKEDRISSDTLIKARDIRAGGSNATRNTKGS